MLGSLRRLFERPPSNHDDQRHLVASEWPAVVYAIGDVHGCLEELSLLTDRIIADAEGIEGEKWIVLLGDYVDRGPNSAGVLDTLVAAPPAGFRRHALAGNHEVMMLDFLAAPHPTHAWLGFGGDTTLASYGINPGRLAQGNRRHADQMLQSHIPPEHFDLLQELPLTLSLPGVVFVHAGLRPGIAVEKQGADDVLWIRDEFFDAPPQPGRLVVHGHTPSPQPVINTGRICVDTGCFATGTLTCVRLTPDLSVEFLST